MHHRVKLEDGTGPGALWSQLPEGSWNEEDKKEEEGWTSAKPRDPRAFPLQLKGPFNLKLRSSDCERVESRVSMLVGPGGALERNGPQEVDAFLKTLLLPWLSSREPLNLNSLPSLATSFTQQLRFYGDHVLASKTLQMPHC